MSVGSVVLSLASGFHSGLPDELNAPPHVALQRSFTCNAPSHFKNIMLVLHAPLTHPNPWAPVVRPSYILVRVFMQLILQITYRQARPETYETGNMQSN